MLDYRESTRKLMHRLDEKEKFLIFEFFFVFSRFEYALLSLGYIQRKTVFADWDRFALEFDDAFKGDGLPKLQKGVKYYEEHPPKKQIVASDRIAWKETSPQEGERRLTRLITSIRTVRNNLFHGEKLGVLVEGDSPRDVSLLEHGLTILYACLSVSTELRNNFYRGAELEEEEAEEAEEEEEDSC